MIATIGSLVQETSPRIRWFIATSLHTLACITTSMLFGATLAVAGGLVRRAVCSSSPCATNSGSAAYLAELVGALALAYALSDLGFLRLPRPVIRYAVPIRWWRRWGPYGGALAYGAALGLGITTRIPFGAFYILCLWSALKGNVLYGLVLMGTYGSARALALIPAAWWVFGDRMEGDCTDTDMVCFRERRKQRLAGIMAQSTWARMVVAGVLMAFGLQVLLSTVL